jgi:hypothetical protein
MAKGVKGEDLTPVNIAYKDALGNLLTSAPVNAVSYQVAARYAGDANYNQKQSAAATITITALHITGNFTAENKIYDGNDTASVPTRSLVGAISGDEVSLIGGTATFSDKNVADHKTVKLIGASLSGNAAGNYMLDSVGSTFANIIARSIIVTANGKNKTYDGTRAATVTLSDNKLAGDAVNDSYTSATFADKNVGTSKTVSVSGIALSGADAGNYSLSATTANTTADITRRELIITAIADGKVYDGTIAAVVHLSDNRVSGDQLTDSYANASFADKNVGNGKAVSVSGISITGADTGNYTFNTTAGTTADITPKAASATADAATKIFGLADPALSGTLSGFLAADNVTATYSRTSGESVGSFTISAKLSPADVLGNYSITYNTANFTITAWTTFGFYSPIDMNGVTNTSMGGSTVPMKFKVFSGATELTGTSAISSIKTQQISCTFISNTEDPLPSDALATGGTSLRYDGQFIYNWQTPKTAGTCFIVTVMTQDGSRISANFKLK